MYFIKYRKFRENWWYAMYRIINTTHKYRVGKEKSMNATCENISINMTTNWMDKAYRIITKLSRISKLRSKIVKNKNGLMILD